MKILVDEMPKNLDECPFAEKHLRILIGQEAYAYKFLSELFTPEKEDYHYICTFNPTVNQIGFCANSYVCNGVEECLYFKEMNK